MSDKATTRKLVLVSVFVMLAAILARVTQEGGGIFPRLWALAVVAIVLALVADFAPQIAGPLALLIALGYLTPAGRAAIGGVINKATAGKGGRIVYYLTASGTAPGGGRGKPGPPGAEAGVVNVPPGSVVVPPQPKGPGTGIGGEGGAARPASAAGTGGS